MERLIAGVASKVTWNQRKRLNRISKKLGLTKSELIRHLINEFLTNQKKLTYETFNSVS